MDHPSEIIRNEAFAHYTLNGDKIKEKIKEDPHACYDVLRGSLTRYAYNRLNRNWMDAEDVVQDAYVKVLETAKLNQFFNFGGLYKIWLDRAISAKRREQRKEADIFVDNKVVVDGEEITLIDMAESSDPSPEVLLEVQDRVNILMNSTNTLKPKAKAIIRLVLLFGYSYKETSEMLGVNIKRIENTLFYFKKTFNY